MNLTNSLIFLNTPVYTCTCINIFTQKRMSTFPLKGNKFSGFTPSFLELLVNVRLVINSRNIFSKSKNKNITTIFPHFPSFKNICFPDFSTNRACIILGNFLSHFFDELIFLFIFLFFCYPPIYSWKLDLSSYLQSEDNVFGKNLFSTFFKRPNMKSPTITE